MPKLKWDYIRGTGYRSMIFLTDEYDMAAAKELAEEFHVTIDESTYAIGPINSRQRAEDFQRAVNRRANQLKVRAERSSHAAAA